MKTIAEKHYNLKTEKSVQVMGSTSEASYGDCDYWVIKLDKTGNILWQKTIGGNDWDELHSIEQTTNDGFILGGHSRSGLSGAKTEATRGNYDCWIIKLNASGSM